VIDSTILANSLDLIQTLLKKVDKESPQFQKLIDLFPQLLEKVQKSEDMFFILHVTSALKSFLHVGAKEIKKATKKEAIKACAVRLLQPSIHETAALSLGNFVIQIFHKVEKKIDTELLFAVVQKVYKSRMPSIIQSLVLIYARLFMLIPTELVEFLADTSIDDRISLKILLDKWLLQQALFRGTYTRNVTLGALLKLFLLRDTRVETLMVIGFDPSHSNVNSEINAPFKILSTLVRFLDAEATGRGKRSTIDRHQAQGEDEDEEPDRIDPTFQMGRGGYLNDERLDTMEGDDDYGDEEEAKGE